MFAHPHPQHELQRIYLTMSSDYEFSDEEGYYDDDEAMEIEAGMSPHSPGLFISIIFGYD